MSSLYLHCGGKQVSRGDLAQLPSPEPRGERHFPVRFDTLVGEVTRGLHGAGAEIADEAFGLSSDGALLFGLMTLTQPAEAFELTLGLRSSINSKLPISLAVGGRVFVCDNMAFSATYSLATRSTTNVLERLPKLVAKAMEFLLPWQGTIEQESAEWAEDRLDDWAAERLMIAAVRTKVIPSTILGRWVREYDDPSAPEHREFRGTRLGLHHAATAALRPVGTPIGLDTSIKRTMALRSMFKHPISRIDEWEAPRMAGCLELKANGEWVEHESIYRVRDAA